MAQVNPEGHMRATHEKAEDRQTMLLGLTEQVSLELGFQRNKSLIMADGKGKAVAGDRANVRKGAGAVPETLSVRCSESSSICRGAQCPRRDVQL